MTFLKRSRSLGRKHKVAVRLFVGELFVVSDRHLQLKYYPKDVLSERNHENSLANLHLRVKLLIF